jgi:hypothetical protein
MTDPHDLDELASAHLDGATTPEEASRVAVDPELRARVEALRAVRDQLRAAAAADAPVDDATRDAAIAAALDRADEPLLADVTPITPARRRGRPAIKWVAAGALLVAAAGRILVSIDRDDGPEDLAATTAEEDAGDGGDQENTALDMSTAGRGSAGAAESLESAPGAATTTVVPFAAADTSARLARDLGPFADLPALTDGVRAALAVPADQVVEAPPTEPVAACLGQADVDAAAAGESLVLAAVAVVADQPVVVTVRRAPDGTNVLTVVEPDACGVVYVTTL